LPHERRQIETPELIHHYLRTFSIRSTSNHQATTLNRFANSKCVRDAQSKDASLAPSLPLVSVDAYGITGFGHGSGIWSGYFVARASADLSLTNDAAISSERDSSTPQRVAMPPHQLLCYRLATAIAATGRTHSSSAHAASQRHDAAFSVPEFASDAGNANRASG